MLTYEGRKKRKEGSKERGSKRGNWEFVAHLQKTTGNVAKALKTFFYYFFFFLGGGGGAGGFMPYSALSISFGAKFLLLFTFRARNEYAKMVLEVGTRWDLPPPSVCYCLDSTPPPPASSCRFQIFYAFVYSALIRDIYRSDEK